MPIYAYKCSACQHAKDVLQKISDDALTVCPACGAEAFSKQVTAAGFSLKGTGWYVSDFRGSGDGANSGVGKEQSAASAPAPAPATSTPSSAPSPSASPVTSPPSSPITSPANATKSVATPAISSGSKA